MGQIYTTQQIYATYKERKIIREKYVDKDESKWQDITDNYPEAKTIDSDFIEQIGIEQTSLTANECAKKIEDILIKHSFRPRLCELYVECKALPYDLKMCNIYNLSRIIHNNLFSYIMKKTIKTGYYHITNKEWCGTPFCSKIEYDPKIIEKILQKKTNNYLSDFEYYNDKISHVDCYYNEKGFTECDMYILSKKEVSTMLKFNTESLKTKLYEDNVALFELMP